MISVSLTTATGMFSGGFSDAAGEFSGSSSGILSFWQDKKESDIKAAIVNNKNFLSKTKSPFLITYQKHLHFKFIKK